MSSSASASNTTTKRARSSTAGPVVDADAAADRIASLFDHTRSDVVKQLAKRIKTVTSTAASAASSVAQVHDAAVTTNVEVSSSPFVAAMNYAAAASSSVAYTDNGAASLASSSSLCLDLFYYLARNMTSDRITELLPAAWSEDADTCMQIMMHTRDCHGSGKGERLIAYYMMTWLRRHKPNTYVANLMTFVSHGYFKDICNIVDLIDGGQGATASTGAKGGIKAAAKRVAASATRGGRRGGHGGRATRGGRGGAAAAAAEPRVASVPFVRTAPTDESLGVIGSTQFELELFAEFLKSDYVKLGSWRKERRDERKKLKAIKEDDAVMVDEVTSVGSSSSASSRPSIPAAYVPLTSSWFSSASSSLSPDDEDVDWDLVEESDARAMMNQIAKLKLQDDEAEALAAVRAQEVEDTKLDAAWTVLVADASASASSSSSSSAAPSVVASSRVIEPIVDRRCHISLAGKFAPSEGHHFASHAKRIAWIMFARGVTPKAVVASSASSSSADVVMATPPLAFGVFNSIAHERYCMSAYRKLLSVLRVHLHITERYACSSQWSKINFSSVPAKCHLRLKSAFAKHCDDRYSAYLVGLTKGVGSIKVAGIQPHELVQHYLRGGELDLTIEAQWTALVAKTRDSGTFSSALSMVDVSGSMSGTPMNVAIAMGLLVAELTTGPYHGRILTFDVRPVWYTIVGDTLRDKVLNLVVAPWSENTNLIAAFDMILSVAVSANIAQSELPSTLFIFSDMQFGTAIDGHQYASYEYGYGTAAAVATPRPTWMSTNHDVIKSKYADAGYTVPNIVFWNLRGETSREVPIKSTEAGCALMSGFSAGLLTTFLKQPMVMPKVYVAPTAEVNMTDVSAVVEAATAGIIDPMHTMRTALEEFKAVVDESER